MKNTRFTISFWIAAGLLFGCGGGSTYEATPYSVIEERQGDQILRMAAYEELRDFMQPTAGASYIFEVRDISAMEWKTVFSYQHDDLHFLDEHNVQVLNEKAAFAYILRKFAVSIDGGRTWDLWNPEQRFLDENGLNHFKIERVDLSDDGVGSMIVRGPTSGNDLKTLRTADFGRTWDLVR